jgi:undecaprenyl-diphosphatase
MFLWMIVQILIESLPISSSGHVMLLEKIYHSLGYSWPYSQLESIHFLFHISAVVIMLCYFFNQWSVMILGKKFELQDLVKISSYQKIIKPFIFILIADVITFFFWKMEVVHVLNVQEYFLPIGFCITAVMLYVTKNINNAWIPGSSPRMKREGELSSSLFNFSFLNAVVLGTVQGLALLPGISRFAATFFAARILGYNLKNSFAVSFLIQFPLVCAAILYGCIQIQHSPNIFFEIINLSMIFGMVVMSFVSYKIFCLVGTMIEQNKIWYFSLYMIIPIVLAILV